MNSFLQKKKKIGTNRAAAMTARLAAGTLPAEVFRYVLQFIVTCYSSL